MARLTTKRRRRLPSSSFGLPSKRKYPITDRRHAGLAKGYAKKMVRRGKLSPAAARQITAKANRYLARSRKRR